MKVRFSEMLGEDTLIFKGATKSMTAEMQDVRESVCEKVRLYLESTGNAHCQKCKKQTCIVNFGDSILEGNPEIIQEEIK